MKLNLNKQRISKLSIQEGDEIFGKGARRSNRRTGNCGYSTRVTKLYVHDCNDHSIMYSTGCAPNAGVSSSASVGDILNPVTRLDIANVEQSSETENVCQTN